MKVLLSLETSILLELLEKKLYCTAQKIKPIILTSKSKHGLIFKDVVRQKYKGSDN